MSQLPRGQPAQRHLARSIWRPAACQPARQRMAGLRHLLDRDQSGRRRPNAGLASLERVADSPSRAIAGLMESTRFSPAGGVIQPVCRSRRLIAAVDTGTRALVPTLQK